MRVYVESELPCPPEAVWDEVSRSRLLKEVCSPLVSIHPVAGEELPGEWVEGSTVRVRSYLFGFVPLGTRVIHFDRVDPTRREIATREHDPLVQHWNHTVRVRPAPNGDAIYRDEVEISAGLLTPLVWLFAQCLYRHRQRRWRGVARRRACPSVMPARR